MRRSNVAALEAVSVPRDDAGRPGTSLRRLQKPRRNRSRRARCTASAAVAPAKVAAAPPRGAARAGRWRYEADTERDEVCAQRTSTGEPREQVRVSAGLLEQLVNLAGESSIIRSRVEQGMNDFSTSLEEMETTIERVREQLRRLEIETETQVLFRQETTKARTTKSSIRWKWTVTRSCSSCRDRCRKAPRTCWI